VLQWEDKFGFFCNIFNDSLRNKRLYELCDVFSGGFFLDIIAHDFSDFFDLGILGITGLFLLSLVVSLIFSEGNAKYS